MPPSFAGGGEILYTSNATTLSNLAAGTTGMYLKSNGTAAPTWQRISLSSASEVMNVLPIANGGTNSGLALSGSSIMIANAGAIVQGQAGTASTVLHGNAGGPPTYGTIMNADVDAAAKIDATKLVTGVVDNNEFNYVDGVTSPIQTQFTNVQTELDATEGGAGLNNDGTYTANGASNYIKLATSLKDADNKLDAQVKVNTDNIATNLTDITALQTEVNNVETGSGLNADGTYTANGAAHYISTATSLNNADVLLDGQLFTTTTGLANEVTRATGAETTLTTNLNNEVTRAT